MAAVMEELELPDLIFNYTSKKWTTKDILVERYKMSRGWAIAGQSRGRGLEDEVQNVLSEKGIPFQQMSNTTPETLHFFVSGLGVAVAP